VNLLKRIGNHSRERFLRGGTSDAIVRHQVATQPFGSVGHHGIYRLVLLIVRHGPASAGNRLFRNLRSRLPMKSDKRQGRMPSRDERHSCLSRFFGFLIASDFCTQFSSRAAATAFAVIDSAALSISRYGTVMAHAFAASGRSGSNPYFSAYAEPHIRAANRARF